jgi:hypothetical protein
MDSDVSLREYIEKILDERQRAIEVALQAVKDSKAHTIALATLLALIVSIVVSLVRK